ncbi:lipopolysaccharide biosynthesis protein [Vibrio chaetopteri]|uniref:lipopolysaccharide biosynthesis protein n=1 Tax=Vibrio chaetopteri TaxID=3016528 RepID=UPI003AB25CB5
MFSVTTIKIFTIALSYMLNLLLINLYSKSIVGMYFEFVALISIICAVAFGGFSKYILRTVAITPCAVHESFRLVKKTIVNSCVFSILGVIFLYGLSLSLSLSLNLSFWLMFFLWFPFMGYLSLTSATLRGKGHHILGNIEAGVLRPILFIVLLLAAVLVDKGERTSYLLIIGFISLVLSSFFMSYFYHNKTKGVERSNNKLDISHSSIFVLSIYSMTEVLYLNLDLVFIGFVMNSESVAIYKVVLLCRSMLLLPYMTFNMIMPFLLSSKKIKANQMNALRLINIIISVLGLVLNHYVGQEVIGVIFGSEYEEVQTLIIPFFAMMFFLGVSGPSLERLISLKKENFVITVSLILLSLSMIVNYFYYNELGLYIFSITGAVCYSGIHIACEIYRRRIEL